MFVTTCSMDEYAEEKRIEKNLIVRSDKYPKEVSEAKTTTNKRLRSTFCIEAIQTQSVARPLCDSRASCWQLAQQQLRVCLWLCLPPHLRNAHTYILATNKTAVEACRNALSQHTEPWIHHKMCSQCLPWAPTADRRQSQWLMAATTMKWSSCRCFSSARRRYYVWLRWKCNCSCILRELTNVFQI